MRRTNTFAFEWPGLNLVAAFENRKIEGLRQFVLAEWMEMTAIRNSPGTGSYSKQKANWLEKEEF
jgi:hypothetical protein